MFDKLFEAQQKAQEIKARLDHVSVTGEVEGGRIRVISTANKEIKEVKIDPELLQEGRLDEIEELLVVALNKALVRAEEISQTEMQAASQDLLGGLGGLGNLFGNK